MKAVNARVARSPKLPRTRHDRGEGVFMRSGKNTARYRKLFKRGNLYFMCHEAGM